MNVEQLTEEIRRMNGVDPFYRHCASVAVFLSEELGGDIQAVVDQDGEPHHYFVELPDGRCVDGRGVSTREEIASFYTDDPQFENRNPEVDDIVLLRLREEL